MHNDGDMKNRDEQSATKGDLDRFATKDDFKRFATKDDLKKFATKDDFKRFATKAELDRVRRDLSIEIARTQADVREIKETMSTKSDIKRILDSIDAFAGKSVNYDRAATLHGQVLTEVQVKLKDHDQRIKSLEMRPPL
jgi:uncharacterized coiled-coil DUF342 family protein